MTQQEQLDRAIEQGLEAFWDKVGQVMGRGAGHVKVAGPDGGLEREARRAVLAWVRAEVPGWRRLELARALQAIQAWGRNSAWDALAYRRAMAIDTREDGENEEELERALVGVVHWAERAGLAYGDVWAQARAALEGS